MPLLQESVQTRAARTQMAAPQFKPAHADAAKRLVETFTGPEGEVLYSATHIVEADNTLKTEEEEWRVPALEEAQVHPIDVQVLSAKAAVDAAKVGLDCAKLAWEIIKSNKATAITDDVKSSVLSASDPDPMNYPGATPGESGIYTWVINDAFTLFGTINYITVKICLQGSWHASPLPGSSAPPGLYLPSLYFNVTQCTVNLPCYLNGTANLENPTNIGTADRAEASVVSHAKLTGGWLFQSIGISVKFIATGGGGFTLIGAE